MRQIGIACFEWTVEKGALGIPQNIGTVVCQTSAIPTISLTTLLFNGSFPTLEFTRLRAKDRGWNFDKSSRLH